MPLWKPSNDPDVLARRMRILVVLSVIGVLMALAVVAWDLLAFFSSLSVDPEGPEK